MMPKIKPLLSEERMHDKFFVKLENRANEIGVKHDKDIAQRLGLSAPCYCARKAKKDLKGWSISDLAIIVKKFRLTGDDVMEILAEGTKL